MAAQKSRTGDGPLELVREGRSIILRMPIEGGTPCAESLQ